MKKLFLFAGCLIITLLSSLNSFSQQTKKPVHKSAPSGKTGKIVFTKADIKAGENLLSKSDCLACHQLKVKVVGPAYSAVAEKYDPTDANISMLVDKIIKGGSGTWGQVPMAPHPTIEAGQAKKMVAYILSLKGK